MMSQTSHRHLARVVRVVSKLPELLLKLLRIHIISLGQNIFRNTTVPFENNTRLFHKLQKKSMKNKHQTLHQIDCSLKRMFMIMPDGWSVRVPEGKCYYMKKMLLSLCFLWLMHIYHVYSA